MYDEVQDLKANLEAINAQTTLQNINSEDSKPSQEEFLMSEILSLKEEINFLKSQNEITNAQLDLGNKLNDLPKSKRVDALIDKVAQVEMNQQKMKADIEANLVDLIFEHTTPRLDLLQKNQKIIADEMKKAMLGVKNFQAQVSSEIRGLKKHVDNLEKISVLDNEIGSRDMAFNSQDLVHNMKKYENNLMDLIYNLRDKGYENTQIENILFEKGHPQFYVQILLKHID